MVSWKWKSYRQNAKARVLVFEWLEAQTLFVKEEFRASIRFLDGQPPQNWRRPFVAPLSGGKKQKATGCNGLFEIRFEVNKVQYRPLGYFSGKCEFTIVYFAEERGGKFDPPTACEVAKKRIKEIDADPKGKSNEWWFEKRINSGDCNE
jgi:hypothetical protein